MPADYRYSGTVQLKPDADPDDILAIFAATTSEALEPGMPGTFRTEFGEVTLSFEDGVFSYEIDGTFSGGFGSDFEDFLTEVAEKHANDAWVDYGADDYTTIYGPTPELIRQTLIGLRWDELQHAQARYDKAVAQI